MNKQIVTIILGIFLISFASAIYAGECLEVNLSEIENINEVYYDVVGNQSNLEGLTISLNGTTANICTSLMYKPDSFTIIFFNKEKEIVEVYSSDGGSSSSQIIYRDKIIDNYIEREVHSNETIGIDDPKDEEIVETKTRSPLVWIFGLAGITIIIITIIIKLKIKNEKE